MDGWMDGSHMHAQPRELDPVNKLVTGLSCMLPATLTQHASPYNTTHHAWGLLNEYGAVPSKRFVLHLIWRVLWNLVPGTKTRFGGGKLKSNSTFYR
jgi:hypothetical protein